MFVYKCEKCGEYQYSSSEKKEDEPCVYCFNPGTKLIKDVDAKKVSKVLIYLGEDSWGRQVYKDENGKLWKDTDNRRKWLGRLYTSYNNEFDGEPDNPMREGIEVEFIPERIIRD